MKRALPEKPLHWVGSAKADLLGFPHEVVDDFGYTLYLVQIGGKPPNAKPWKGTASRRNLLPVYARPGPTSSESTTASRRLRKTMR